MFSNRTSLFSCWKNRELWVIDLPGVVVELRADVSDVRIFACLVGHAFEQFAGHQSRRNGFSSISPHHFGHLSSVTKRRPDQHITVRGWYGVDPGQLAINCAN